MKGKWRVVFGLLLSAGAIALVLRNVDVHLAWGAIRAANFPLLTLAAAVATAIFPLRAIRWKYILGPVDPDLRISLLWRATAIGFSLNNALPARLGEVARAYVLSRESSKVGFAAAFASLALDRLFDAIVLIGFLLIGLMGVPAAANLEGRGVIYASMATMALAAGALLLGLLAMAFFPSHLIRLWELFARRVAPPFEARGSALLASFASGLSVLSHPGRFAAVLFWSVLHWLTNALAFWIGFHALGLTVENSFLAALTTQSVIGFAVALPGAPGGLGVFQLSGVVALRLFGVPDEGAVAWGLAYWAFSFIPITVIGMMYFARMGLSLKEIRDRVQNIGARDRRGSSDSNG